MVDKVYGNGFGYLGPTFTGLSWDDELWVQAMIVDRVLTEERLPRLQKKELSAHEAELYWLLQSAVNDVADDDRQWDTATRASRLAAAAVNRTWLMMDQLKTKVIFGNSGVFDSELTKIVDRKPGGRVDSAEEDDRGRRPGRSTKSCLLTIGF